MAASATASATAAATPLPAEFAALAARLPTPLRRLLVDNAPPEQIALPELLAALGAGGGGQNEPASLRLLRAIQGGAPEPPRTDILAEDILTQEATLSSAQCAALRAAVDAHASVVLPDAAADTTAARRRALADHLGARAFGSQLDLSRDELVGIIGTSAVDALYAMASNVRGQLAADYGADAPVEILVRRYTPSDRPWIPFHNDRAASTVNVALCDDSAFDGGVLLGVYGEAVHRMPRCEGTAMAHPPTLLHGCVRRSALTLPEHETYRTMHLSWHRARRRCAACESAGKALCLLTPRLDTRVHPFRFAGDLRARAASHGSLLEYDTHSSASSFRARGA